MHEKGTVMVTVSEESPLSPDAIHLMDELSDALEIITGSSGKGSFGIGDLNDSRAMFAVARNSEGNALGCGSFRPLDDTTTEIKRMYAKVDGAGVGTKILAFLEDEARKLGYWRIVLETRLINSAAVAFYEGRGYIKIPNYGRYAGRPEAVCFEKRLLL